MGTVRRIAVLGVAGLLGAVLAVGAPGFARSPVISSPPASAAAGPQAIYDPTLRVTWLADADLAAILPMFARAGMRRTAGMAALLAASATLGWLQILDEI